MTRAAKRTVTLVRGVRPEQMDLRTPCTEFDVRALITHLEWVADLFESLARKDVMPPQGPYAGDFPLRVERMLAAWSRPESWEGVSPGFGMPQSTVATMCLGDLVAHGWDLAQATGQPYEVEEESAARLRAFVEETGPMGRKQGVYGEPIAVPDDASELERMLGLSGRDPAWKP